MDVNDRETDQFKAHLHLRVQVPYSGYHTQQSAFGAICHVHAEMHHTLLQTLSSFLHSFLAHDLCRLGQSLMYMLSCMSHTLLQTLSSLLHSFLAHDLYRVSPHSNEHNKYVITRELGVDFRNELQWRWI
jgi:hypothetical protein